MARRFAAALGLLALVFAIGWVLYGRLFADEMPLSRLQVDAGQRKADAATAKVTPIEEAQGARVFEITGNLERRNRDSLWEALQVGDAVGVNDALRTIGEGASAVLLIGAEGTRIELIGEFTVPTLTTKLSTVEIVDGRIAANLAAESDAVFRVEARGSDAVAQAKSGVFSVLSLGEGQVTVASQRGHVDLSAAGKTVTVEQGQQSIVWNQAPPSPPKTIPSSLLLKVGKTARELRVRETLISGTTNPGAIVRVGDTRVQANERGEFKTIVALKEGSNRLTLIVEDASGRKEQQTLPTLLVDSKAPDTKSGVEW